MKIGDAFVVYGWRAGRAVLQHILSDMKPEALDLGLRVVFAGHAGDAVVGEVLASASAEETMTEVPPPTADSERRMREAAEAMGLAKALSGPPRLWLVADFVVER
jgi:hypothetical protein